MPESAQQFDGSAKAIYFVYDQKLRGVEIVVSYDNIEHDFVVARFPDLPTEPSND
jgi:hypothetical protein